MHGQDEKRIAWKMRTVQVDEAVTSDDIKPAVRPVSVTLRPRRRSYLPGTCQKLHCGKEKGVGGGGGEY